MSWGKLYIGNKGYIPALQVNKDGNPVGTVITFAGATAPQGYLLCDGRAVSRTVYSELFSVIGTTYGPGDGSSSFNLPDYSNIHISGIPDYYNYTVIPKTNLTTTNTTFNVPEDGLLRVLMHTYGGALEEFCVDDTLMCSIINSFTNYSGYGVGFIPITKGVHVMRTSTNPNRIENIIFYPFMKTGISEYKYIKF